MTTHIPNAQTTAKDAPPVTPHSILVNTPYIMDTIMQHATRSTLISCLRVNPQLHDAAGHRLYRTVRVYGQHKLRGLLLGAEWEEGLQHATRSSRTPALSGFKNRLLTRIRVLLVGWHPPGPCKHEGNKAERLKLRATLRILLRNVHTVRIVLPIRDWGMQAYSGLGCNKETTHCDFLPLLSPRKVVLRNANGPTFCELARYWPDPEITTLVWIVPTDCGTSDRPILPTSSHRTHVPCQVPFVRVVFHSEWEVFPSTPTPVASSHDAEDGVHLDRFHSPLELFKFCYYLEKITKPHIFVLYGVHTVELSSFVQSELLTWFPDRFDSWSWNPTVEDLRQLVMESLDKPYIIKLPRDAYEALSAAETRYELDDEYHH
ncbi:uncharacterized protein LOC62_01G001618 [Vanrija pseudolonga]|uniref:Uncharacterized protein n=1 Tax=Vanrija pseudolonga TaxID=143232 RepID=A0AAF0Y116_9TREE|nr:hypothetical protein LOC62_01G001618 [Vanrija pseudolonga]